MNMPTQAVAIRTTPRPVAPTYLPEVHPDTIERAMAIGDLGKMTPEMRVAYYVATCQSAGLNPLTRPFDLIKGDDGTVRLYPNKVGAEQLRRMHGVSIMVVAREHDKENGLYTVTVRATTKDGRSDEAQGIVDVAGKKGTALANALMKAETKSKRRVTLAVCGLGYEESEDVGGHPVRFDYQQGLLEDPAVPQRSPGQGAALAADDLFGEGGGDRMRKAEASALIETIDKGLTDYALIKSIDKAWTDYGLTPGMLKSYWTKRCQEYGVENSNGLTVDDLRRLQDGVIAWIAAHPPTPPEGAVIREDASPTDATEGDDLPEFAEEAS